MATRIYFASDIHGSERCWRKFLGAPKFYEADVIIVGGDITGKFVFPIVRQNGYATAKVFGIEHRAETPEELEALQRRIADAGAYSFVITPEEYVPYAGNQEAVDNLFRRLVTERVGRWIALAEERLRGTGVRCLVSGGNDDFLDIDEVLERSDVIEVPEGRVLDLGEGFQILGMSYGNRTPWDCPRDVSEEELASKLDHLAGQVENPERAIFDVHVPPYGSGLDFAPRLDADLRPIMGASGPELAPVGSTAVRAAIERYQPALGLHGHVHESRGVRKLGKTTIVNPGSEYQEGILNGALIDLDRRKGVKNVQLVSG